MRTFEQVFEFSSKKPEMGEPQTTKRTDYSYIYKKIPDDKLGILLATDPITFNAINTLTQIIIGSGWKLDSNSLDEFLNSVGKVGNPTTWDEIVETIFRNSFAYGKSPVELIYTELGDRIVDLLTINPEKIDYARTTSNQIAVDKYSNPLGYVHFLPAGMPAPKDQKVPPGVVLTNSLTTSGTANLLFLYPKYVGFITLYTLGDNLTPIGLIAPSYNSIIRRIELEESYATALDKSFPVRVGSYGDNLNRPSPQKLKEFLDKIENLRGKTDSIALPNWAKIEMLESKGIADLLAPLDYYLSLGISGFGVPKAFAVGLGSDVNRSTLNVQRDVLSKICVRHVKTITRQIEKKIFEPICKMNNISPVPKFVWNEIDLKLEPASGEIGTQKTPMVESESGGKYSAKKLENTETPKVAKKKNKEFIFEDVGDNKMKVILNEQT